MRDLVTFTEEILNGKLHFLCSENAYQSYREHLQEIWNKKKNKSDLQC